MEKVSNDFLDFIVIGAQKAGTTALFEYMRRHSEIYIPAGKEVPFLTNREYSLGPAVWRESYFADATSDQKMGTITPHYLGDASAPERIAEHFPSAKLIAILRAPWARTNSQYLMAHRGGQDKRSYQQALTDELNGSDESTYISWSLYGYHTERFEAAQGSAVHLVLSEDLLSAPTTTVNSILQQLSVGEVFDTLAHEVHNVAGGNRFAQRAIAVSRKVPALKKVWRSMPADRRAQLAYNRHTKTRAPRIVRSAPLPELLLSPAVVEEVDGRFLTDSQLISDQLLLPPGWLEEGRPIPPSN